MEVMPIDQARQKQTELLWIGRPSDPPWQQAMDLFGEPGVECLVAVVLEGLDEAAHILQLAQDVNSLVPVVILTEPFSHSLALQIQQLGAYAVLPLSDDQSDLDSVIAQARKSFRNAQPRLDPRPWRRSLVGSCSVMERLAEAISLIAERRSTVLITGETGTGKEVVARALHEASGRKGPLVSLNCTALPESLLEAELFGHTKGAFTGAQNARAGRFEAASKGTIFLDEIGDMPIDLQAKLLRVLQEREIQRLGSSDSIPIDVRVIAATNADLLSKVEDGRFREDLYFRLNVVPIHLPPLRDRVGDLPLLAKHFVQKICAIEELSEKKLTHAAMQRLQQHHWPGNIRELENTIERAIAFSGRREELLPGDFMLPVAMKKAPTQATELSRMILPDSGLDFEAIIAGIERNMIEQALSRTNGNKSAAADLLRLKRTTLGAKMRTLGTTEKSFEKFHALSA